MRPIRLMIADDCAATRESIARFMREKEDIEVVAMAADGVEAELYISLTRPDVLILDVVMPRMDGYALMQKLRQSAAALPRVVIISSMARESLIKNLMALGAYYYMVKPLNLNVLYQRVVECASQTSDGAIEAAADNPPREAGQAGLLSGREIADALRAYAPLMPQAYSAVREVSASGGSRFLLHTLGIPMHVSGARYLETAGEVASRLNNLSRQMTKTVYPAVARAYGVSAQQVERAIRHAIALAWERGGMIRSAFFPGGRPTNSEVIACLARYKRQDGAADTQ